MHLELQAGWWINTRVGLMTALSGHHFPTGMLAIPACLPPGGCQPRRSLTDAWGLDLSAAVRPVPTWSRVSLSAGAGLFWSAPATDYMNRSGVGFATGVSFDVLERALGVSMRARYFPNQLGEIRWLASPAVTVRF